MKWSLLDTEEESKENISSSLRAPLATSECVVGSNPENNLEVRPPSEAISNRQDLFKENNLEVEPPSEKPFYEPARISLLSHFSFTFLVIAIVAGALAGAGWYFRDEVKAGFARFNTPVTELQKYTIRMLDDPAVNQVGSYTSLAIGSSNHPVISYRDDTALSLMLYVCADASCSSGTARTLEDSASTLGTFTAIAIGRDNNPVIAYRDSTARSLKLYSCDEPNCSSGTARTLEDTANSLGWYISLVLSQDGYPVISYHDATSYDLKLYVCADASCSSGTARTLDTTGFVGQYTSTTIGRDGNPIISYSDNDAAALKLYVCADATCSSGTARTLDDTANEVGYYTSVAIGRDGYPIISYYDATTFALKFYKCNNIECSSGSAITLDDSANAIGLYTSVAIGRDGYPIISYYDATAQDLKLLKCGNASCTATSTMTIDAPGNVGQYTSMKIGNDGYPVISYYDQTAGALKFAYVGARVTKNTSPKTIETDGLVGYWTFDGQDITGTSTVLDRSSSHATGTMVNMATSSRVMGKHGQGLQLDGINDSISTPPTTNSDKGTLSIWTKPTLNLNSDLTSRLFVSTKVGGCDNFLITFNSFTGYNRWEFYNQSQCAGIFSIASNQITSNSLFHNWQHIVVTWDINTGVQMFLNGTMISSTTGTTAGGTRDIQYIGSDLGYGYYYGIVDDVRTYNRVLSQDEIKNLYNAGAGVKQGICGEGGVRDADGNVYGIVQIGTQCWLDRNMNVGTRINASSNQTNNATIEKYCYSDTASNCTDNHPKRPDGGLYQWNEAMQYSTTEGAQGICPSGWHIPTDAEWYTLENYLKDAGQSCDTSRSGYGCSPAGSKLGLGGSTLFESNYSGYSSSASYYQRETSGYYWLSSVYGSEGRWRSIDSTNTGVYNYTGNKSQAFSIRCIKD